MVFVYVWGAWGTDKGWMPLPIRPQQYCDPASLVLLEMPLSHYLKIFLKSWRKYDGKTNYNGKHFWKLYSINEKVSSKCHLKWQAGAVCRGNYFSVAHVKENK